MTPRQLRVGFVLTTGAAPIRNATGSRNGTYEVDGYTIRLTYATGGSETFPFFYDPAVPSRVWIGSDHYPVNNPSGAICIKP